MTYRDEVGVQRFEFCKTSNKKASKGRLIDQRKGAMNGILSAVPIQPLALDDLKSRYLSFVGHQRGEPQSTFSLPTRVGHEGLARRRILGG